MIRPLLTNLLRLISKRPGLALLLLWLGTNLMSPVANYTLSSDAQTAGSLTTLLFIMALMGPSIVGTAFYIHRFFTRILEGSPLIRFLYALPPSLILAYFLYMNLVSVHIAALDAEDLPFNQAWLFETQTVWGWPEHVLRFYDSKLPTPPYTDKILSPAAVIFNLWILSFYLFVITGLEALVYRNLCSRSPSSACHPPPDR